MATLSANITASQRTIRVTDGAAVTSSLRLRVDDELIDFIRFEPYPYINGLRQKGLDPTRWVVARGVGQSTKASHLSGATLTAAIAAAVNSETLIPPDPFADATGGDIPDPAGAPDGQVPTTESGVYSLETAEGIGPVQVVTRIVTSAEILAMFDTPVTILAGEAGKILWPIGAFLHLQFGTVLYDAPGADSVVVIVGGEPILSAHAVLLLGATADIFVQVVPAVGASGYIFLEGEAVGSDMTMTMLTENPTLGDGELAVTVLYRVVELPAPAASLSFTQQPTDVVAFEPITPAVTVTVLDAESNPAPTTAVTISLNGAGTLDPDDLVKATANGVATFSNLIVEDPGTFTLEATAGALSDTSDSFVVIPD